MPIYRMNARDRWRVRIWQKGRRKDWIFTGSKAEARQFEARMLMQGLPMPVEPPSASAAPSFSDFCVNQYAPHAVAHLRPSTWNGRKYQVARFMRFFETRSLDGISALDVEKYKEQRLQEGIRASAINDDLKVLRVILQYAIDLDLPVTIPRFKRLVERGKRRIEAWTEDEVGRLLAACAEVSPEILPMVVFLANTGCRKGEAIALHTRDIDLEHGVVHIQPNQDWSPKNNRPREVPISDSLRPWLEQIPPGREHAFVCPDTRRKWAMWPERPWNRAIKAAGITGGPHRLRHTYASHLVRKTGDLFLVSRILGHSHTRVTEIYAHLLEGAVQEAGKAVSFPAGTTPSVLDARQRWGMAR
jgi:integrase